MSNNVTLKDMYNRVAEYGYCVRKNRLDGLKMWLLLKDTLSTVFGKKTYRWNIESSQISGEYSKLGSKYIGHLEHVDEDEMDQWEKEHFLVQHIRILHESPEPTIVKMLQVAYNTGQLKSEMEESSEFYENLKNRVVDYPSEANPLKIRDLTTINRYISRDLQNTHVIDFVEHIKASHGFALALALAGNVFACVMPDLSATTDMTDSSDELPMSGGAVIHTTFKINFSDIKYI